MLYCLLRLVCFLALLSFGFRATAVNSGSQPLRRKAQGAASGTITPPFLSPPSCPSNHASTGIPCVIMNGMIVKVIISLSFVTSTGKPRNNEMTNSSRPLTIVQMTKSYICLTGKVTTDTQGDTILLVRVTKFISTGKPCNISYELPIVLCTPNEIFRKPYPKGKSEKLKYTTKNGIKFLALGYAYYRGKIK